MMSLIVSNELQLPEERTSRIDSILQNRAERFVIITEVCTSFNVGAQRK